MMRELWILLGLSFLSSAAYATCHDDDTMPQNCSLDTDFCGWTSHNWTIQTGREQNFSALQRGSLSGFMNSTEVCVTSLVSHCLRFQFLFKSQAERLTVSIFIPHNRSESELWSYSGISTGDIWSDAEVPLVSDVNFSLIISARRNKSNARNRAIRVDNLQYQNFSCSSESPSAAPVGVIVGIVVAVVVVVFVLILVVILIRRETTWLPLSCFAFKNADSDETACNNGTHPTANSSEAAEYRNIYTSFENMVRSPDGYDIPDPNDGNSRHDFNVSAGEGSEGATSAAYTQSARNHENCLAPSKEPNDGYKLPVPKGRGGQSREETDTKQQHAQGSSSSASTESASNYDALDFSNAEQEKSVYTSLH